MRLLVLQRPTQEFQVVHVLLEPAQAEQEGAAVEGFDGRVVGLNTRPVDAALVRWLHGVSSWRSTGAGCQGLGGPWQPATAAFPPPAARTARARRITPAATRR